MRPLPPEEVHVWRVPVDAALRDGEAAWGVLSEEERARAAAFRVEDARRRFVASRASLRRLVAAYAPVDPREVAFSTVCARCGDARHGKPRLVGHGDVRFSTSHAGGLVVHAFARGREVGVDVEALDARVDPLEVAAQFFAEDERARLAALADPAARLRAFLDAWTRKEARLKLTGAGLAALERAEAEAPDALVLALDAPPGYVGALAVDAGVPPRVRSFAWPPSDSD